MKFLYRHRGSVSIFLLVIMVPMLIFSFSVLDICKILLAKDAAKQATDLALNSGLTSYDKVLKDMYGLLATSQSEEELTKKLTDYYVATLQSSGVSTSESDKLTVQQVFAGLLGTGVDYDSLNNNNDLLKVFAANPENSSAPIAADKQEVSAVSNPDVMHREIVEYMKYRAPVYITNGILEKINVFKDIPNQTAATNSKLKYEKTLSDINNASIAAYVMLQLFRGNNVRMENGSSAQQFEVAYPNEKIPSRLIGIFKYNDGQKIPYKTLRNNDEPIPAEARTNLNRATAYGLVYKAFATSLDKGKGSLTVESCISDYGSSSRGKHKHNDAAEDLETAFDALEDCIESVNADHIAVDSEEISKYIKALKNYAENYTKEASSDLDGYYSKLKHYSPFFKNNNAKDKTFYNACKDFYDAFVNAEEHYEYLQDKLDRAKEDDDTSDLEEELDELGDAMDVDTKMIHDISYTARDLADEIESSVKSIKKFAEECYGKATPAYEAARAQLSLVLDAALKQRSLLEELSGDSGGLLDEVFRLFNQAKKDAGEYNTNVDKIETDSMKTSMKAQFVNEAKDIKELTYNDLAELKTLLKGYIQSYDDYIKAITSVELFHEKIFLSESEIDKKRISTDEALNKMIPNFILSFNEEEYSPEKYCTSKGKSFNKILAAYDESTPGWQSMMTESSICPLVNYIRAADLNAWTDNNSPKIESNRLYIEMKKVASPKSVEKDESAKNEIKSAGDSAPKADEISKGNTGSSGSSGSSGSAESSKASKSDGSDFKPGDYKTFDKYKTEAGLEYIVDKTADEGQVDNVSSPGNAPSPNGDDSDVNAGAMNMLSSVGDFIGNIAEAARDNLYITEYLTNDFSCHTTDNTDKMLNGDPFESNGKANVVWYGSELEYILYGCDTIEGNQVAAGAVIFGIRFVLNLIYSFTDTEINSLTNSISAAATALFPFAQPLVKAVLHIGLSIAESSYDLMVLRDGGAVPIFKTRETWVCKGSGVVREIGAKAVEKFADHAIDTATDALISKIDELGEKGQEITKDKLGDLTAMVEQETTRVKEQIENDILTPIESAVQSLLADNGTALSKDMVKERLDTIVAGLKSGLGLDSGNPKDDDVIRNAEREIINKIDDSILDEISQNVARNAQSLIDSMTGVDASSAQDGTVGFTSKIRGYLNKITSAINTGVENAASKIEDAVNLAIDEAVEEAKNGVEKGSNKLKSTIQSSLNKSIRGHEDVDINYSKSGAKTSKTAMISMTYKEYLYIFTVIGLAVNESNMLQRAAQLMQANCVKNGAPDDFDINQACTIIKAESGAAVRTVVFGAVYDKGQLDLSGINRKYEFRTISYAGY